MDNHLVGVAPFGWRRMQEEDLKSVARVAALVHPNYPEKEAVFAERLTLDAAGQFVLIDPENKIAGYIVSHLWPFAEVPKLDDLLGTLPQRSDNYYIHDIALLPEARGRGAARKAVEDIIERMKREGFSRISLVAIAGTQAFWERQGFTVVERPHLTEKLASYDHSARYMSRAL